MSPTKYGIALQAKSTLTRLRQLEAQAAASADELNELELAAAEAALTNARQQAAATHAAVRELRQQHQARMAKHEADLAAVGGQQQGSLSGGSADDRIPARRAGSCLALIMIGHCHNIYMLNTL